MNRDHSPQTPLRESRFAGCLLGGAAGDALGGPVEFYSLSQIRQQYGLQGVTGFAQILVPGKLAAITDDTQMTLFTAEGLLRAHGGAGPAASVHHAYLRWLHTQGVHARNEAAGRQGGDDGWLVHVPALRHRRAPGNTCLSALQSGKIGTVQDAINDSKGCGGIMRAAPVGLFPLGRDPFDLAAETAAVTHGHPSGYLSAGCLALMVHDLAAGKPLDAAVEHALDKLANQPGGEECRQALRRAVDLWRREGARSASAETIETLGAGWVGEEALAVGVYCALAAEGDFARGVRLAVNHSGDSDSTGSIAGNLLGTQLGREAVPPEWLDRLELREEIEALAADLFAGFQDREEWRQKYPAC